VSVNLLRLIPTDPQWEPDEDSADRALAVLRDLVPRAAACDAERFNAVTFIDQGSNFEAVRCPHCRSTLDMDWFGRVMDRPTYDDLLVVMPCCSSRTSLNELDFYWPAGFARFALTATSPNRRRLTDEERCRVEDGLGHGIRQIWAHY
jgi:hypothetical protein